MLACAGSEPGTQHSDGRAHISSLINPPAGGDSAAPAWAFRAVTSLTQADDTVPRAVTSALSFHHIALLDRASRRFFCRAETPLAAKRQLLTTGTQGTPPFTSP